MDHGFMDPWIHGFMDPPDVGDVRPTCIPIPCLSQSSPSHFPSNPSPVLLQFHCNDPRLMSVSFLTPLSFQSHPYPIQCQPSPIPVPFPSRPQSHPIPVHDSVPLSHSNPFKALLKTSRSEIVILMARWPDEPDSPMDRDSPMALVARWARWPDGSDRPDGPMGPIRAHSRWMWTARWDAIPDEV